MPEAQDIVAYLRSIGGPTREAAADLIDRLTRELDEAREVLAKRSAYIIEDAETAIKISDGIERMKAENRRLRDALYQFEYPPDASELRAIADEIDCGKDCEHGYTEWDTNAHVCSRENHTEGCAAMKAWTLRQFADAIDVRAALNKKDESDADVS